MGAAPGERRGGRKKGTPNRKVNAIDFVADLHGLPRPTTHKLAKERLRELMEIFIGAAAHFQPSVRPGDAPKPHGDWNRFMEFGRLGMECAAKLAPYESPTFRAIMVTHGGSAADAPAPAKHPGAEVIPLNDAVGASRVYRMIVSGGGER